MAKKIPVLTSMNNFAIEVFGWYGVVAILGAYALLSFNIITANRMSFQILNFTGAIGIIIVSIAHRNYQPAVIDIVWAMIALIALIKIVFFKRTISDKR